MLRIFIPLIIFTIVRIGSPSAATNPPPTQPEETMEATATYDPLSTPELPENPSAYDSGKYLYYFHCMPCHGDVGQGLTDEFRQVWVEDHRNCWEKGCHGGRVQDEGFPIPTIIPAIISTDDRLAGYQDFGTLVDYLRDTHPPQAPGRLTISEYKELGEFLWEENQKPTIKITEAAALLIQATETATPSNATPTTLPVTPEIIHTASPVQISIEANVTAVRGVPAEDDNCPPSLLLILGAAVIASLIMYGYRLGRKPKSPKI